jgi:asparagine synthase (glutamine-hydrolysing)
VAVAYSGGLDSSILASVAREGTEVRCYTACMRGSPDARNAEGYASVDGFALDIVEIDDLQLLTYVRKAATVTGTTNPVRVAYTIPVLAVLDSCRERRVLTGAAADELFAGYAKYASAEDPGRQMSVDLEKALSELESLRIYANQVGKHLAAPFAQEDVVSLSARIPLAEKLSAGGRKLVLREVGRALGLDAADRPKKAAQYSSGVMRCMRRSAKGDGLALPQWVERVLTGEG